MFAKGFSLIELSIVLVIISILTSAVLSTNIYTLNYPKQQTELNFLTIRNALDNFVALNNRLPCPTNPSLALDSPNYAMEACECDLVHSNTTTSAICPSGNYIGGGVPVSSLNLPTKFMYDGFGNKIFYAVTEGMVGANNSCQYGIPSTIYNLENCNQGIIPVIDEYNNAVMTNAAYILHSTGKSKAGAWKADGTRYLPPDPTLVEYKNYEATSTGGPFVLISLTKENSNIIHYENKAAILYRTAILLSEASCNIAQDVLNANTMQICFAGETNCALYLTSLAQQVSRWCAKHE